MRAAPFLLLLLAGCAARPNTPSLLPRGIENQSEAVQVPRAPPVEADPAINDRITKAQASLAATARTFAGFRAQAEALVEAARGKSAGSEQWLSAQAALGDLDVLRAQSSSDATDLELLMIERAGLGKPPYPGLDEAYRAAQAQFEEQSRLITTLSAQLAG